MTIKKIITISLALFFLLLNTSFVNFPFGKPNKKSVRLEFLNYVGSRKLQLDSTRYLNKLGQDFKVTKFKYYIGNIVLKQKSGVEFKSDSYFLIDEDIPSSKQIQIENIPAGDYVSLTFIVGIDSLHNCSGAQSGALDPTNAMFWAWNTGYIFLKFDGASSFSKSPVGLLEYHIGGYRQPNNCIRKVQLNIEKKNTVQIKVDILELLGSKTQIDFKDLPTVTDFRHAVTLADNYQNMFSIISPGEQN